jgi:xanthine dehydrogenase accessory factor
MRHLDIQVIEQALQWAQSGQALWLCTVLSTYGSAPRAPGAMLVANAQGQFVGSLSGGCVEDEFRDSLARGELLEAAQSSVTAKTPSKAGACNYPAAAC